MKSMIPIGFYILALNVTPDGLAKAYNINSLSKIVAFNYASKLV